MGFCPVRGNTLQPRHDAICGGQAGWLGGQHPLCGTEEAEGEEGRQNLSLLQLPGAGREDQPERVEAGYSFTFAIPVMQVATHPVESCHFNQRQQAQMTFGESIKTCFSKYADFNGRADRTEYWWFELFCLLVIVGAGVVNETLSNLASLALALPSLAVGARRLHDINKSGWWQLLYLIPVIGWIVVIYWAAQPAREPNRF